MTDYKEMLKLLSAEADAEGAALKIDRWILRRVGRERRAGWARGQFEHNKSGTGSGGRIRILI